MYVHLYTHLHCPTGYLVYVAITLCWVLVGWCRIGVGAAPLMGERRAGRPHDIEFKGFERINGAAIPERRLCPRHTLQLLQANTKRKSN